MGKIVRLEYDNNQFVEFELKQYDQSDRGLGGLDKVLRIGQTSFDRSITKLVSFLNTTSDKIKREITSEVSEVSVTIGASFSAEGNLIVASSTSEVNLAITITFKGGD